MDFGGILQKIGQVSGAMNPAYQQGVQLAQQEQQRKRHQVLMSSPMMQKALLETFGPEVSPMLIEAAGAMPSESFLKFAQMFPVKKQTESKPPPTHVFDIGDKQISAQYIGPGGGDFGPNKEYQKIGESPRFKGREPKTIDELYQEYNLARLKGSGTAEAMRQMFANKPEILEKNPWIATMFEGMPALTKEEFIQGLQGQTQRSPAPSKPRSKYTVIRK